MKGEEQDIDAKAEATQGHAEGKSGSETMNRTKNKVNDALT